MSVLPSVSDTQIASFLSIIDAVNQISEVHIDLTAQEDQQRDTIAFLVDSLYRQFKDHDWEAILKGIPERIQQWNTPSDTFKATSELLKFIHTLYEYRILEIMQDSNSTFTKKKNAEALLQLFSKTVDAKLEQGTLGKAIKLTGISRIFLPDWYKKGEYRKT